MTQPSVPRASRAIGAMFFSVFGGVWCVLGLKKVGQPLLPTALVSVVALAFLGLAIRVYRGNRTALAAAEGTPEKKRSDRIFHLVNAGQGVAMFLGANVLVNLGHGEQVLPLVCFIVGLHFLPLARLFEYRPHFITGAAMMAWAVGFALRPESPIGCFGAGLILWASTGAALAWPSPRAGAQPRAVS